MAKNTAKTARRQLARRATSPIWRIFAELDKPKRTIEDELNSDTGKHVLAMFLN